MPPIQTMPPRSPTTTPNTVRARAAAQLIFLACGAAAAAHRLFASRDGPLRVQRRRPGGDGGQRLGRRPVGAELQLPRGGHVHLAARGPAQGPSHQRGRGDPALPHLHVRRGRPHHAVEVPVPAREEAQEQVHVSSPPILPFRPQAPPAGGSR